MGVRLVKFDRYGNSNNYSYDHNDLINRDMMNQHPIYAITGLQEVLNILEDSIEDLNQYIVNNIANNIEVRLAKAEKDIQDLYDDIMTHLIRDVISTYSIKFEYNTNNQTLKSHVKLFNHSTNAIQLLATGLYVPPIDTTDTNTITWNRITHGYTPTEITSTGIKISHYITSWHPQYSEDDCDAWSYASNLINVTKHTSSMTGIVTAKYFDYYTHNVQISSTSADDDVLGVIIGYVLDKNGAPHTLSIVLDRQTTDNSYSLWYDYMLPDAERILIRGNGLTGTKPDGVQTGNWNVVNNITVEIYKEGNIVKIKASNWGTVTLNDDTEMTVDLDDYEWGEKFSGDVRYGYLAMSQFGSFKLNKFEARNEPSTNEFKANVKVANDVQNAIVARNDGLFVQKFNISKVAGNGLVLKSDGYYVQTAISKQPDNSLVMLSDGYYVRDYRNIRTVTQTKHGFAVGDFIYYHPFDKYQKALGLDDYDINIVGMVTKVINANSFEYQWSGFFQTDLFNQVNGFVQGMPVYISDEDPGKVVQKQPDISKAVGYPVENIGIIISIERGIQYNQEASIGDFKVSANTYNVRSDGFLRIVSGVEYKQSLAQRLLTSVDANFKAAYMTLNNSKGTFSFINTDALYTQNKVPDGMNLFIKAF